MKEADELSLNLKTIKNDSAPIRAIKYIMQKIQELSNKNNENSASKIEIMRLSNHIENLHKEEKFGAYKKLALMKMAIKTTIVNLKRLDNQSMALNLDNLKNAISFNTGRESSLVSTYPDNEAEIEIKNMMKLNIVAPTVTDKAFWEKRGSLSQLQAMREIVEEQNKSATDKWKRIVKCAETPIGFFEGLYYRDFSLFCKAIVDDDLKYLDSISDTPTISIL